MRLDEPVAENPSLIVENLEADFELFDGPAEVIDGVNFSIGKGGVVTIAGETGCGKSVTMKSILRLLNQPPARVNGDVTFDGTKLPLFSDCEFEHVKGQRMSLVFQDPMSSLNPMLTVGEQLTDTAQFGGDSDTGVVKFFCRRFNGERDEVRERVPETLREVQMPDPENIMDSYPSQLSGGMRQRALITQALLNEPDLLIADEVGTALDVMIHDQILDLLKGLIENHDPSVLMITHNLGVARQASDRVYVMYGGRIVETASTDKLFENPKHPYTQGFTASTPRLTGDEVMTGIDGSIPEYPDSPPGCRFALQCLHATIGCEEACPEMYERGPQIGVECVLYDEVVPAPERPTVEETQSRMTRQPDKQMGDD